MDADHRAVALALLAEADSVRSQIVRARSDCRNDAATENSRWHLAASAERRAQVHATLALDDRLAALNIAR